jgi:uncharacterized protein (TIGR00369 family)
LDFSPELCTVGGVLHGGALMGLADQLGGLCAFLNLPAGAATATISSSTNFLRPVREGAVIATARPLRVGRTVIVVETEIRDGEGRRLVAQVVQAQAVIGRVDRCSPADTGAKVISRRADITPVRAIQWSGTCLSNRSGAVSPSRSAIVISTRAPACSASKVTVISPPLRP